MLPSRCKHTLNSSVQGGDNDKQEEEKYHHMKTIPLNQSSVGALKIVSIVLILGFYGVRRISCPVQSVFMWTCGGYFPDGAITAYCSILTDGLHTPPNLTSLQVGILEYHVQIKAVHLNPIHASI